MGIAGTWNQRLLERYSLSEMPHDPATMTASMALAGGLKAGGVAAGLAGTDISAKGTIAAGEAAQQAGQMAATADINEADLSSDAALTSSKLASDAALNSSQLTATAQEEGGQFAEEGAEFEAGELTQNASTTRAQAQRQAFDIDQQTRLALSTLRARASGGGLSATGETNVATAGQIGARGAYQALGVMAAGENTARGLEDEATAALITGAATKYGADLTALGTRYAGNAASVADLYSGDSTSVAALYKGSADAAAAIQQGNAALQAAQSKADATVASGIGSAMTNIGSIIYPTPTGRTGASV